MVRGPQLHKFTYGLSQLPRPFYHRLVARMYRERWAACTHRRTAERTETRSTYLFTCKFLTVSTSFSYV